MKKVVLLICILILGIKVHAENSLEACGVALIEVTNSNNSGAGSLRQAVIDASNGDEITFNVSTNGNPIVLSTSIQTDKNITFTGNGANNTILDGGKNDRIFLFLAGTTISIEGITVRNGQVNQNNAVGGGIIAAGDLTMTNCKVIGNTVTYSTSDSTTYGGGIVSNGNGTLILINCLVAGNSALTNGGGIYNSSGDLFLINTTVTGNRSLNFTASGTVISRGGGIYNAASSLDTLELTNSIVWGNFTVTDGPNIFGTITTSNYSIVGEIDLTSTGTGNFDGTDTNNDPQFKGVPPYNPGNIPNTLGDYRLKMTSPMIDVGNNAANTEVFDLDNKTRIVDGDLNGSSTIDLGCYEFFISPEFITEWKTDNPGSSANNQIKLPIFGFLGSAYNYTVAWGDGTSDTFTTGGFGNVTHTYPSPGTYQIRIAGSFPRILFNGTGDRQKILKVLNWGTIQWSSMDSAFEGCSNLRIEAIDTPDLSNATSLNEMFKDATSMNDNLNNWDVSTITAMTGTFEGATSFNTDLSNWDVSNVTLFARMFQDATSFNQPLNMWQTPSLHNTGGMFRGASSFNQDIAEWDVSNVTEFLSMFENATAFNQDIGNWDTSSATTFARMFAGATSFDQDLGSWDVSSLSTTFPDSIDGANNMFVGVTLSTSNYDSLLVGWNTLDVGENAIPSYIPFHGGNSMYCAGADARESLINTHNWTINDGGTISPLVAICKDITVALDATGNASITGNDVDNGSTFGCTGSATLTVSPNTFDCSNIGPNTVILTVTDANGDTITCSSTVTVEDNIAPIVNCAAPFTIQLDENGDANIAATSLDGGSTDNCGIAITALPSDPTFLQTTVAGGAAQKGNMFDVRAVNDIIINSFDVRINGDAGDFEVYYKTGSYLGSENNAAAWTQVATIPGVIKTGLPTPLNLDLAIYVPAGNTVAFYVTTNGAGSVGYTSGSNEGALFASDTNLEFFEGIGKSYPFAGNFRPRIFNGRIRYSTPQNSVDFNCSNIGANNVQLLVVDTNGNSSTCTTIVTVEDNVPPVTNCTAPFTIQLDANGDASITVSDIENGSTDACGIASTSIDITDFTCADVGPNTVTLTATDVNGNFSTCTTIVTVEDNVPPVANCAAPYTIQLDANGSASITAADIENGSTDNCGIASTTIDINTFDCSNVGDNTVTLTVTDLNGNQSTCTTLVTVEDNLAPVANCAAPLTVQLDSNGNASITAADIDNGSTDNCGIASTTIDIDTFNCSNVGDNTVTLTITDVNGNTATCTTVVTIEDSVAPVANCAAPFTIQLDTTGNASITVADIENGSTDACGIASTIIDINTFDCSNVGDNTVTLTVTDVNGNTSICTTIVTIEDNIAPVANCAAPFTIQLDANGNASITAADIENGSTDNCGIASATIDIDIFDCSNVGDNTVTLTVTDVNGNQSTCTTFVTVEDNLAPVANCAAPFTIQLDANGEASITVADIENGSTDNCGIDSTTIDIDTFTCSNVGDNTVTLTITDVNGNTATCTTVVTIEDSVAPTIVCPPSINVNTDPGNCFATVYFANPIALDNCGIDTVIQTAGLPNGSQFPVGANTVEFTATDVNGNSSTCNFNITVTDNEPPVAVCQNVTIQLDEFGNASIVAADVDGGSTDQCGVASISINMDTFDCSNVGDNNVTLTVTDVNGNASTCTAIVTVEDVTAPIVACQNIVVELDPATGSITIAATNIDNGSTDACGIASYELDIDTFDCSNIGDNSVILTVTDVNGNSDTCTAIVTIEDNTSPVLVCQDFTIEVGADGTATLDPNNVIASNDDACGILTVAVDITQFNCADIGTPVTVQVFSQDNNGNLATCNTTVTVVDNLAPVVNCPADQTVDPGSGSIFYSVPDYFATGEATAIDNCTDPVTIMAQNPAPGTAIPDGVYTVTLTATDQYGNIGTCDFELTVDSVLGTGTHNQDLGSVTLYPNPAKAQVTIGNPQRLELEAANIYDLTGRLVKSFNLKGMTSAKTLNVDNLAVATYVVIIKGKQGQITKRILKE